MKQFPLLSYLAIAIKWALPKHTEKQWQEIYQSMKGEINR